MTNIWRSGLAAQSRIKNFPHLLSVVINHIYLREFTLADAEGFYRIYTDAETIRFQAVPENYSVEVERYYSDYPTSSRGAYRCWAASAILLEGAENKNLWVEAHFLDALANFISMKIQPEKTLLKRGDFIGRLCKQIELREFILKELVDRTEDEVPRHIHEDAHFLFIIDGLYITSARGVGNLCSSATLIFNPPGTTHHDRFHKRGGRFFTVSLTSETLGRLQSPTNLTDHPVGFSGGEVSWLGSKLYKEFQNPDEVSAVVMEGLALELLGCTLRSRVRLPSPPGWLQLAHQLIHDRFTEPLTVSEIAQTVGAHPVYVARVFRKHYRLTIGEYLRRLRVEFACRQIQLTDVPLSHIAAAAGFYDQSHFTRTFKRLTGMTPTEYRAVSRP